MRPKLTADGGLLIPMRAEAEGMIGDAMVPFPPGSEEWEEWAPHAGVIHGRCGGPATPVIWGRPTEADRNRTPEQGDVMFGGDVLTEPLRHWFCEACDVFLDPEELTQGWPA